MDFLLDNDNDLKISGGDLAIGDSTLQDVSILLKTTTGDLKNDPVLGPNLVSLLKKKVPSSRVQSTVRVHLERDGKNYDRIKDLIKISTNA